MTTTPYHPDDIAAAIARALVAARDRPDPDLDGYRSAQKYAGMSPGFPRQRLGTSEQRRPAPSLQQGLGPGGRNRQSRQRPARRHHPLPPRYFGSGRRTGPAGRKAPAIWKPKVWINTVLVTARGLHSNFYENELPADTVRGGIMRQCEATLPTPLPAILAPSAQPAPTDPSR